MDQLLLRPEEAARVLNIGRTKAYELIMKNEIPSIAVGKCRRIPAEALKKWVDERLAEQTSAGAD